LAGQLFAHASKVDANTQVSGLPFRALTRADAVPSGQLTTPSDRQQRPS